MHSRGSRVNLFVTGEFIALLRRRFMPDAVNKNPGRMGMQAREELERVTNERSRPVHTCPHCAHSIEGAIGAEYLSALDSWNVWQCDNCDRIFRTHITYAQRLPRVLL